MTIGFDYFGIPNSNMLDSVATLCAYTLSDNVLYKRLFLSYRIIILARRKNYVKVLFSVY